MSDELVTIEEFQQKTGIPVGTLHGIKSNNRQRFPGFAVLPRSLGKTKGKQAGKYRLSDLEAFMAWYYKKKKNAKAERSEFVFHDAMAQRFITGSFATRAEKRRYDAAKARARSKPPKTLRIHIEGDYL